MPPKKTAASTTAQRRSTRNSTRASDTKTETDTNGTATGQDMGNILSSATKSVKSKKSQKNMAKTANVSATSGDTAVPTGVKSIAAKGKRKSNTVAAQDAPDTSKKVKTAPPAKKQPGTVEEWFDTYASSEDPNEIDIPGIMRLLDDLDIRFDGASIYVLSWKLGCATMGTISKKNWVEGMSSHKLKNNSQLLAILPKWLEEAKPTSPPTDPFRTFYKYMFQYAKVTPETRSVAVETAMAFFAFLLNPVAYDTKFDAENSRTLEPSVHPYPHTEPFVRFLNDKQPVKVINKDQWESFVIFNNEIHYNLDNYNPEGAWPGLYDQYVEWRKVTEGLQVGPKDGPDTET